MELSPDETDFIEMMIDAMPAEPDTQAHYYADGAWTCSGALRITDPAESRHSKAGPSEDDEEAGAATLAAVPGRWLGAVVRDFMTAEVLSLTTWAEAAGVPRDTDDWLYAAAVEVDSDLCGVFDDAAYPAGDVGSASDPSSFYNRVILAAEGPLSFGLVDLGAGPMGLTALLAAGGTYDVLYCEVDGLATAVRVVFQEPQQDEDSSDEESAAMDGADEEMTTGEAQ